MRDFTLTKRKLYLNLLVICVTLKILIKCINVGILHLTQEGEIHLNSLEYLSLFAKAWAKHESIIVTSETF